MCWVNQSNPEHSHPYFKPLENYLLLLIFISHVFLFCFKGSLPFLLQLLTLALPTSLWMNHGGTQSSSSIVLLTNLSVTVLLMGNGTALLGWLVMLCPPSASQRTTVVPMPQSGWMAAILKNQMALFKDKDVLPSMGTAASGTPQLMSRHAQKAITSIALQNLLSATMSTVDVSRLPVFLIFFHLFLLAKHILRRGSVFFLVQVFFQNEIAHPQNYLVEFTYKGKYVPP